MGMTMAPAPFTNVIERKPDDWDSWHKRGWTFSNLQQWSKAIDDYSEAIKLQPGRWESWTERGYAHLALHQWDKSIEDYTKGHIWLTVEAQDTDAVVRVRDTGIGIPAELLSQVFRQLQRATRQPHAAAP